MNSNNPSILNQKPLNILIKYIIKLLDIIKSKKYSSKYIIELIMNIIKSKKYSSKYIIQLIMNINYLIKRIITGKTKKTKPKILDNKNIYELYPSKTKTTKSNSSNLSNKTTKSNSSNKIDNKNIYDRNNFFKTI